MTCEHCLEPRPLDELCEVDDHVVCLDCRDELRTCDACQQPLIEPIYMDDDETYSYVVCSPTCAEALRQDIGCAGCGRIPADDADLRTVEYYDRDTGRWEGGKYCDHCR